MHYRHVVLHGGQAVNGVISKGPLSNALVFLDLDGDNVLDADEQSIRTDANGNFTINTTATDYKIVALTMQVLWTALLVQLLLA